MKYITAKVSKSIRNAEWAAVPLGEPQSFDFLADEYVKVIGYYKHILTENLMCICIYTYNGVPYVFTFSSSFLDLRDEQILEAFSEESVAPKVTKPSLVKAVDFLDACKEVQVERGKQYQNPLGERSFKQVADSYNAITGRELRGSDIALIQQILKDVRQWQNPNSIHEDSLLDGVSYASLKAEEIVAENTSKPKAF